MMKALTFSDVLIVPKYSDIRSRKEVDLSTKIGVNLSLPVVSANMKSITGKNMALAMHEAGGMGILHRFNTIEEAVQEALDVQLQGREDKPVNFGVSIGVQEEDKERFDRLYEAGARIFALDVAHGHQVLVKEMLKWIASKKLKDVYLIAGNVATAEGALSLAEWGANCIKCGIGPGRACTTRKNTGVGMPQLTALEWISSALDDRNMECSIISDGGIVSAGDIPKALRYADACMMGSFLSGTTETPGKVFRDEHDQYYKVYQGSASGESKNDNGQPTDFVEGISIKIPFRGHVKYVLKEVRDGLRSCFSYIGARNLSEFKAKCDFVEISGGGKAESKL